MCSTSISEKRLRLLGCGIDAERIDRFPDALEHDAHPFPFVFTSREIAHARSAPRPAAALCASWCVKEAILKALGTPYDWTACEVFLDRNSLRHEPSLAEDLRREFRVSSVLADITEDAWAPGTMTARVLVFQDPLP